MARCHWAPAEPPRGTDVAFLRVHTVAADLGVTQVDLPRNEPAWRACLTSGRARRVMIALSTRLLCLALLTSLALPLGFERSASAQMPVFAPVVEEPFDAAPAASKVEPAEPSTAPEPAAPPAAQPPPPSTALQPAKAAVIIARPQRAEVADADDADDVSDQADRRPRWYGWQTLIADGSSLAAILIAQPIHASNVLAAGLVGYEFAPGILHFVHKNPGRGFASMGIRLGMPLAGAIVGATLASGCDSNRCEEDGAAVGLLLGMGGAIAIDAAVFAYADPKHPDRRFSLRPVVSVTSRGAWLGLGGTL